MIGKSGPAIGAMRGAAAQQRHADPSIWARGADRHYLSVAPGRGEDRIPQAWFLTWSAVSR